MPPLSSSATLEPEAPVEQKTNVHAGAEARSAVSGDPAPGTTADPRAGQSPIDDAALRGYPPIAPETPSFDVAALRRFLDGDQAAIKNRVRALLSRPEFRYYEGTDTVGLRERVFGWAKEIAKEGIGGLFMPKSVGGQDDLAQFMAAFETLGFHDVSLVIKFGVQFGLWGGSVLRLGTDYHHRKYLPATATMALPGCFAMTEIGHGSNVRDIETTATYDPVTQEFDLHSPTFTAGKNYIGNAGVHGKIATVFAQLKTRGESHGVHAFVVPIRDDAGRPLPGVRLEDNGEKLGLNGVDNGRVWFDHARVPRTELLDRYAQVAPDGAYTSSIASPAARFFTTLGTLVAGRISVGHSGLSIAKVGLAIAVRYGARRRQFGPAEGKPETILLDYPAHQRRLMPLLANAYALDAAFKHLTKTALTTGPGEFRQVETTAAALKAFSTWNTTHTLQTVPRGVRRRGLPGHQPLRRAQGRQRHLHHLRGRQHRAHATGRQEPAHRLCRHSSRARPKASSPAGRWTRNSGRCPTGTRSSAALSRNISCSTVLDPEGAFPAGARSGLAGGKPAQAAALA